MRACLMVFMVDRMRDDLRRNEPAQNDEAKAQADSDASKRSLLHGWDGSVATRTCQVGCSSLLQLLYTRPVPTQNPFEPNVV
jgi:hypothetical protein